MKFFVISDTHFKIDKALKIYSLLENIDAVIHLGDHKMDAEAIKKVVSCEVFSVKGNAGDFITENDYKVIDTEYGKLLLTHGYTERVDFSYQNILYKAESLNCKAALFGHTHIPIFEDVHGIYLVNPGSLTLPRDGSSGSYAIVNTSPTEFSASIVYYSSLGLIDLESS